jgi:hypothetical protein
MFMALLTRIVNCNHQRLGYLIGMITGLVIGLSALPYLSMASLPWIGALKTVPLIAIKIISVPFISGTFANIFSNLGSGIDIITNEKTIFHLFSWQVHAEQSPSDAVNLSGE